MRELRFDDRVAVVTGAGNGLGRQYALDLGRRGAKVVVNDVSAAADDGTATRDAAEVVAQEITDAGGVAIPVTVSVADPDSGRTLVERAVSEFGRLDILINNAGIGRPSELRELRYDLLLESLSVHLLGTFHTLLPAWQQMIEQGGGAVVNTTSSVGLFGQKRSPVYAAGKMGVVGMTRVLALEGAEYGIRVNAIAPVARSQMSEGVYGRLDPKLDPELVSAAVLALAHPDSPVTGEVISAGGGRISRLLIAAAEGYFSAELTAEEAFEQLVEVAASESVQSVPTCAMDEIDLIRQCFPDLADAPMPRR